MVNCFFSSLYQTEDDSNWISSMRNRAAPMRADGGGVRLLFYIMLFRDDVEQGATPADGESWTALRPNDTEGHVMWMNIVTFFLDEFLYFSTIFIPSLSSLWSSHQGFPENVPNCENHSSGTWHSVYNACWRTCPFLSGTLTALSQWQAAPTRLRGEILPSFLPAAVSFHNRHIW